MDRVAISVAGVQFRDDKMPKVPSLFRDDNRKSDDYDPKVVSIGPYYHGQTHLQFVQDFKREALEMFIEKIDLSATYFREAILKYVKHARRCYVDDFSYISDDEFARMLLLDACFILNEIEISIDLSSPVASGKRFRTVEYLGDSVYFMTKRDLCLLENQVPFWILYLLVSLRYGDQQDGYKQFVKKVEKYCNDMCFEKKLEEGSEPITKAITPNHLVDVYWSVITRGESPHQAAGINVTYGRGHFVLGSVTELKSKGIAIRPSPAQSLREGVVFTSSGAVLTLPRWYITLHTKSFFMNVIAYEFYPSINTKRKIVSAYVNFMKSLVSSPDDVKELREKEILLNSLGTDREVVQVYNALKTYGAEDPFLYLDVKAGISGHCNSRTKTWLAEFRSTYFKNPWTTIALVGGILIFLLTAVQTYCSILQVKPSPPPPSHLRS